MQRKRKGKKRWTVCLMILVCVSVMSGLTGCSLFEKAIPSGYTDCVEHCEDGFMDYTDYCKYFYTQEADAVFARHEKYQLVKVQDIERITGYFNHCGDLMRGSERGAEFDVDLQCISAGDRVYIDTKEGEERSKNNYYEKYECYSVYLYDVESHTLFYVHNNG